MVGVDYSRYPGPPWNHARSVEEALSAATAANDETSFQKAYDEILFAVGNNHAGTYFPVAVFLIPELAPLLVSDQPWPRRVALEVLVDLTGSFEPEPGFEAILLPDGNRCGTAGALKRAVSELASLLHSLQAKTGVESELATEILCALETK